MFFLDLADRRDDFVVAERLDGQVETHLVVAHAGTAVRNGAGSDFGSALQGRFHDQIAIRHQQRILALVTFTRPHEGLDEIAPDGWATIDRDMAGSTQFRRALLDVLALRIVHAAGIGKNRVHVISALLEPGNAKTRVEPARERKHDVFGVGNGEWGIGNRRSAGHVVFLLVATRLAIGWLIWGTDELVDE